MDGVSEASMTRLTTYAEHDPDSGPSPHASADGEASTSEPKVCIIIGICTANRPDRLWELLSALSDLDLVRRAPRSVTVVIADNSRDATARGTVERFATAATMPVEYHHVLPPGLSVARNRVLEVASELGEVLAIIDDDEVPEPQWLDRLLECRHATGAALVVGPVYPRYEAGAPDWIREGGFLDLATYPDNAALRDGISGNALMHLPTVMSAGLRFDERYGRTGGEDQLFFRQAAAGGVDIRFAARATVYEAVPPDRVTFRYLLHRELRKGNTLGLIARDHPELGEGPARRVAASIKWYWTGMFLVVLGLLGRDGIRVRRGVLRAVRAAGMIGGLAGWRYIAY